MRAGADIIFTWLSCDLFQQHYTLTKKSQQNLTIKESSVKHPEAQAHGSAWGPCWKTRLYTLL